MFKTRLLSGILLVIIALVTVITGGDASVCDVLLAISLIGMTELYKVFGIEKKASGHTGIHFCGAVLSGPVF